MPYFFIFNQILCLRPPYLLLLLVIGCKGRPATAPKAVPPDYKKAMSFLNNQNDSAFYYFNKVATGSRDSMQLALAYNHMAVIQSGAGDYYGSEENLLTSLKYLDEHDPNDQKCLISDYNELGRSSSNLKNYDAAIGYYDLVLQHAQNEVYRAIALNNQAVVYQDMGQYAKAVAIYQSVIDRSKTNKKEYARILSNLARAKWLHDSTYRAAPELWEALQIRKDLKDEWGLNASYAHLSDYYAHTRPDSALFFAERMYAVAQDLNSPGDEQEALQKLVMLSPAKSVKQYFSRYQSLSDSIETARNTSKNQFALIRYEAQKNKADNLRLQKDNTDKQLIIYGILAFFIAGGGVAVAWSRNAFRKYQLKTSQRVHDVVANGLYRIMTGVEHQDTIEKNQLLDDIEILYEQSRDISYELPGKERHDISDMLASFSGKETKVLVVGSIQDVEDRVKKELEKVLLELMVNMKKHSAARNVVIRFGRQGGGLTIGYTDDGVGLPPSFQYGNGLLNTENRIKILGGRLTFDKNNPKGLKIHVFIPIA